MNKIDWYFWGIICMLAGYLIVLIIAMSGCAVLQPRPSSVSIVAPTPAIQIWQAAKSSNWIVTMSILGIAGGVFATLNGQKWGLAIVVSCSVALFMSLAVARFAWWMAICGLFGSVGLCIVSIMSRKRALVEIIKGVQDYRGTIDTNHIDTDLDNNQSESTKKIVKKIKGKI